MGFTSALFLFISSLLSFSVSSNATEDCKPASCGEIGNITYPFWLSGTQANCCGYPELKLTCDRNSTLLKISNEKYHLLKIFYDNNSILVVDRKLKEAECPVPCTNISFAGTPLSISPSPSNKNLSIYFNCSIPVPEMLNISCDRGGCPAYVFRDNKSREYSNTSHCSSFMVPVLNHPVAETNKSGFWEALKDGFFLSYYVADCSECKASGGRCGFDYPTARFTCICHDRNHLKQCTRKRKNTSVITAVVAGIGGALLVSTIFLFVYQQKRRWKRSSLAALHRASSSADPDIDGKYPTQTFSYGELEEATDGFSASQELGNGGFGTVYKGKLRDGRTVAVKRLYQNNYRRMEQFINEIHILSLLRHQNLVSLYGCSSRHSRELLLVYEYIPNGTVADHLHGLRAEEGALTWPIRLSIATETADALAYLHAIEPQIIHRDIKTNNILLDTSFHVKVADFGLSRLFPVDATHVSTAPQGTPGYVDPEYFQCYLLTDRSDVYSFGVVLVELISSKPAVDIRRQHHEINLSKLAMIKIQNNELDQLVDPMLGYEADMETKRMTNQVAELAFRCLQPDREMRPPIKEVLEVLKAIENGGNKGEKTFRENDAAISRNDAPLLKSVRGYSPDSVQDWLSSSSTITANSNG